MSTANPVPGQIRSSTYAEFPARTFSVNDMKNQSYSELVSKKCENSIKDGSPLKIFRELDFRHFRRDNSRGGFQ